MIDGLNVTSKAENQPSETRHVCVTSHCLQQLVCCFKDCHTVRNSGVCRGNEYLPSTEFGQIVPLERGAPARLASNCLQAQYLCA